MSDYEWQLNISIFFYARIWYLKVFERTFGFKTDKKWFFVYLTLFN